MGPFRAKQEIESSNSDLSYYDRWIVDIVRDQGSDIESLLMHVKHHADEGLQNGVDWSWVASILNLVDIIARRQKEPVPSLLQRIDRLFHHWKNDPYKMTPPPTRMPPSVRNFLKLGLEPAGETIEETKTMTPTPEPEVAGKYVGCPIVGRSS